MHPLSVVFIFCCMIVTFQIAFLTRALRLQWKSVCRGYKWRTWAWDLCTCSVQFRNRFEIIVTPWFGLLYVLNTLNFQYCFMLWCSCWRPDHRGIRVRVRCICFCHALARPLSDEFIPMQILFPLTGPFEPFVLYTSELKLFFNVNCTQYRGRIGRCLRCRMGCILFSYINILTCHVSLPRPWQSFYSTRVTNRICFC